MHGSAAVPGYGEGVFPPAASGDSGTAQPSQCTGCLKQRGNVKDSQDGKLAGFEHQNASEHQPKAQSKHRQGCKHETAKNK
jgi:hypothetical protein